MNGHILLVEDEHHIAQGVIYNLKAEGYRGRPMLNRARRPWHSSTEKASTC